jgi:hypothetical protein
MRRPTLILVAPKTPVIRNVLFLALPSDKVERHLVSQALVREVAQALNTWAYSRGA